MLKRGRYIIQKPKLTISQQIEYMRDEKGIKFNIVNESEALDFLKYNNYYFKLKAFAKNYPKYNQDSSNKKNKYINLEFAYLKELSTLDALFRKLVLQMVLDVEHFLKVQLISDFSDNPNEDGYTIINNFLTKIKPQLAKEITSKSQNSYCHGLIEKYQSDFAIWNIIEVISFGDFIDLYEYYYSYYDNKYNVNGKLLPIKGIRNAAAHNNCLINSLLPPYSREITAHKAVMNKISKIKNMPKKTREAKMKNPVIHDFVVLLDVYFSIIKSEKTLTHGIHDLYNFFYERCLLHKDYFDNNDTIKSSYNFIIKVLYFYTKKTYNINVEQKTE